LEEVGGEITEDQDIIWLNQQLQIKDKIDAYGIVLTDLEIEQDKLKEFKRKSNERIQAAINRAESKAKRLKSRLYNLSEGSPLRGHIFSFHPYIAKERKISEGHQTDDKYVYLTIEIRKDHWNDLLSHQPCVMNDTYYSIKKETVKVSELPDDHPAIIEYQVPSVRIT